MVNPSILILASKYDFSVDYVISILHRRGAAYLRLNKEDIDDYDICLNPQSTELTGKSDSLDFEINKDKLKAIWYRRPTYLRVADNVNPRQRFVNGQWLSFMQGLMIYENCQWMNHPQSTYKAENKIVQLNSASRIGFSIPMTRISNSESVKFDYNANSIAIKGLDTVHIRIGDYQLFGYTNKVSRDEIQSLNVKSVPAIFQEYLEEKMDIRVTVVGDEVFAASITDKNMRAIEGDWRLKKNEIIFIEHQLPSDIEAMCIKLTESLGLSFGAIDLAYSDGRYYFFEVNPTGEWAWLVDDAGLPIDNAIANFLSKSIGTK